LVTHVNVVFSVWEIARNSRDACVTTVGASVAVIKPESESKRISKARPPIVAGAGMREPQTVRM
jgi:hypothetical protein